MSRWGPFLLLLPAILTACAPATTPSPGQTSAPTAAVVASPTQAPAPSATAVPSSTTTPPATSPASSLEPAASGISLWSLGGNGWALNIGDKLLIFDFVGPSPGGPIAPAGASALERGVIDPDEIGDYEVNVFVTHAHADHYDPVILAWEEQVEHITYFFGWQAGNNPDHHYLVGPKAGVRTGGLEVYTINSYHSDVSEVAFLVRVEGITIYHNGDYMASYQEDFEYLKTITDYLDVAFVIGWPFVNHQHFRQGMLLDDMFQPACLFANCPQEDTDKCRQFAELLAEHGAQASIRYAEHRGDHFTCTVGGVE